MSNEIPYQVGPQVEALQQERANCVAYGNDTRVASIDRQLAALGVEQDPGKDAKSEPPKGRRGRSSEMEQASDSAAGEGTVAPSKSAKE